MLGFGPLAIGPIADSTPVGAASVLGTIAILAPAVVFEAAAFAPQYVLVTRPPVSLKEAARADTDVVSIGDWSTVFQVSEYLIPATPEQAQRIVSSAYVVGRATAVSVDGQAASVEFRVVDLANARTVPLFKTIDIDEIGFTDLPFTGGIFGAQEILQVRSLTGAAVHVTVSFVNRTQEEYNVIV